MGEGFLGHTLGAALAGILAVVSAVGGAAGTAQQPPAPGHKQHGPPADKGAQKKPLKRLALADKAGVPLGPAPRESDIGGPTAPRGLGTPPRRTLGKPLPQASARYVII